MVLLLAGLLLREFEMKCMPNGNGSSLVSSTKLAQDYVLGLSSCIGKQVDESSKLQQKPSRVIGTCYFGGT